MNMVSSADDERHFKEVTAKDNTTARELIVAAKNLLAFVAEKYDIKPGEPYKCPYFRALHDATVKADAWW